MIRISTVLELRDHDHSLGLFCIACNRWGTADLENLIGAGRGGLRLAEARFRCSDCGSVVEKQIRPPVPMLGDTSRYIDLVAPC